MRVIVNSVEEPIFGKKIFKTLMGIVKRKTRRLIDGKPPKILEKNQKIIIILKFLALRSILRKS